VGQTIYYYISVVCTWLILGVLRACNEAGPPYNFKNSHGGCYSPHILYRAPHTKHKKNRYIFQFIIDI
jgi:hypothetical protein